MRIIRYSWNEFIQLEELRDASLFNSVAFLTTIAEAYQKDIRVYTVFDKDKAVLSLPVLHKNKDAKLTTHFFYQAIIKHQDFSERSFLNAWELIISALKQDFVAIDLKLAPYAEDIRPFTWAGFGHKVYYTAVVNLLEEINYSENIRRSLKKSIKAGLSIKVNTYSESIADTQLADMHKNGLSKEELTKVKYWMGILASQQCLIQFELLDANQNSIGSSVYLFDDTQAYLIAVMGGNEESGGQAYLYDQAFAYFRAKGLTQVDLLGANIPSIAIYKSKLGAQSTSYCIVSYRKYYVIAFVEQFVKQSIKAVLKSIRIINK